MRLFGTGRVEEPRDNFDFGGVRVGVNAHEIRVAQQQLRGRCRGKSTGPEIRKRRARSPARHLIAEPQYGHFAIAGNLEISFGRGSRSGGDVGFSGAFFVDQTPKGIQADAHGAAALGPFWIEPEFGKSEHGIDARAEALRSVPVFAVNFRVRVNQGFDSAAKSVFLKRSDDDADFAWVRFTKSRRMARI